MTRAGSVAKRSGLVTYVETIVIDSDAGYPARLRAMRKPPKELAVRGQIPRHERAVAIVGARAAASEDTDRAFSLALALAERGVLVVSGGALGVDAAAHRGALGVHRDGGSTVAVLGCGLAFTYPEQHRALFDEMCARGGGLISQFPRGAPPRPWQFARRNQTIAGMCDAVVVVGAGARSGALQTARAAQALGRVVAAVPGRPGCETLIAAGAAVVSDVGDLERALDGNPVRPRVSAPAVDAPAYRVLTCLDLHESKDIDDIVLGTGLSVRDVQRALTHLELDGLAVPTAGRSYVCSQLAGEFLAMRGPRG